MQYQDPSTKNAIEQYAERKGTSVAEIERKLRNYTQIYKFETGSAYEAIWTTTLLDVGSKAVYIKPHTGEKEIVLVSAVNKATVKVKLKSGDVTFNKDGLERGSLSRSCKRIVRYVEGLSEILIREEASLKQSDDEHHAMLMKVKGKSKAIYQSPHTALTQDQLKRLSDLFDEFDKEGAK